MLNFLSTTYLFRVCSIKDAKLNRKSYLQMRLITECPRAMTTNMTTVVVFSRNIILSFCVTNVYLFNTTVLYIGYNRYYEYLKYSLYDEIIINNDHF